MRNESYTKSGPGRCHNHNPSKRTLRTREPYGNKLARTFKRQVATKANP